MTFKPGDPRPPGAGRKPGTPNKPRLNLSYHLTTVMDEELENIQTHLKRLRTYEPAAYFATLLKLLPYTLPRGGMDAVDQLAENDEKKRRDEEVLNRAAERVKAYLESRKARGLNDDD